MAAVSKRTKKEAAIAAFCVAWVASGLTGFVSSLLCFLRTGTMLHKVMGLLLSVFTGPFFWAYVFFTKDYCRKWNVALFA